MLEILTYQFFQNALIMSILASISSGIIGTYIVIKRMSMITGSISHTAFGGLGIGYFLGSSPLIGALIFSLLAAMGISLNRKGGKNFDIMLSFSWATGMAIGLIFIFMTPGYAADLFSYLFGNIILVSTTDLIFIALLDTAVVIATIFMFNSFLSVTFDEEYSEIRNMPVSFVYTILFSLIALTIVMLIQAVGIVLLVALLTIPAATSRIFCRIIKMMMIFTSLITLFAMVIGLFVSYLVNMPTGPVIVLVTSGIYIIGILSDRIRQQR